MMINPHNTFYGCKKPQPTAHDAGPPASKHDAGALAGGEPAPGLLSQMVPAIPDHQDNHRDKP